MIKKLESYQLECYENITKAKIIEENENLVLEIKEWQQTNKLMTLDHSKRVEVHSMAKEFNEKLYVNFLKIQNELLMNKFWFHVPNNLLDVQIHDELISFEGYLSL